MLLTHNAVMGMHTCASWHAHMNLYACMHARHLYSISQLTSVICVSTETLMHSLMHTFMHKCVSASHACTAAGSHSHTHTHMHTTMHVCTHSCLHVCMHGWHCDSWGKVRAAHSATRGVVYHDTQMSSPGVEPGLSRPRRDVLTTRRWGR